MNHKPPRKINGLNWVHTLAKIKNSEISSRSYKRLNGESDVVWIAFDQDEHEHVARVVSECRDAGIGVAYSNPCFEVWLILHFEDYDRDEHRRETQILCEKVCPGYAVNAGKTPEFNQILAGVDAAVHRAKLMHDRREKDGANAPQTSVFELINVISGKEAEQDE